MSEHRCRTLTAGCFRCDLNRDEMEADRLDHLRVAKLLTKVAQQPRRRPGTRSLLLDMAAEAKEHAEEVQAALSGSNRRDRKTKAAEQVYTHLFDRSDRPSLCCATSDWWLLANGHSTTQRPEECTCPHWTKAVA